MNIRCCSYLIWKKLAELTWHIANNKRQYVVRCDNQKWVNFLLWVCRNLTHLNVYISYIIRDLKCLYICYIIPENKWVCAAKSEHQRLCDLNAFWTHQRNQLLQKPGHRRGAEYLKNKMSINDSIKSVNDWLGRMTVDMTGAWCIRNPTHLVVIAAAAVCTGSDDLRGGRAKMTRAHDAGFGHTKTKNQIVSPERNIDVCWTSRACLLGVNWVAKRWKHLNELTDVKWKISKLELVKYWVN